MNSNAKKTAAAALILWLWFRRNANAGDYGGEGSSGPQLDPSPEAEDVQTFRLDSTWKSADVTLWSEPSTPGYREVRHAIRGPGVGHWGSASSYLIGDEADKRLAFDNERAWVTSWLAEQR